MRSNDGMGLWQSVSGYVTILCALQVGSAAAQAADTAWVARINGAPTLSRGEKSVPLQRGDAVAAGDVIQTDAGSKVKLLLADDSILNIGPKSRVTLQELLLQPQSRKVRLQVLAGRFQLAIAKFFGGPSDYEVRIPTAVAGVRGTVLWGDTDLDTICALDGSIEVRALSGSGGPAQVTAGQCVKQMGAGLTASLKPNAATLAAFLKQVTLD